MAGNMDKTRLRLAVGAIAEDLRKQSDTKPTTEENRLTVKDLKSVQPEVMEHLTRLALMHGVPAFTVLLDKGGSLTFSAMAVVDGMCVVCSQSGVKRHDDGVCYDCRDPMYDAGDQPRWGTYTERLGIMSRRPKDELAYDDIARSLYYDIKDGGNVAKMISDAADTDSVQSLTLALRRIIVDIEG